MKKYLLGFFLIVATQQSFSQTLLGSSTYGGGTGDQTNVTTPPLKLVAPTGYVRVPFLSADAGTSTVFNFQAGKNVYWGESSDNGQYLFRGRDASFDRNLTVSGTFNTQGISLNRSAWPYILFSENGVQGARIQGTGGMFAVTSTNGASNWLTVNSTSGNVGIGSSNPSNKLSIVGSLAAEESILNITNNTDQDFQIRVSAANAAVKRTMLFPSTPGRLSLGVGVNNEYLTITNGGDVGIGTTSPTARFQVVSSAGGSNTATFMAPASGPNTSYIHWGSAGDWYIRSAAGTGKVIIQDSGGNVGIGTANPNQKLTVNGTIYGKEVKVDLSVPGPDYVFSKTYSLRSLKDVESYIEENQHLPEVPSASEMEKDGIMVGEMNMLLLKKVEELTLYMIELKKENEELKKRVLTIEQTKK